MHKIARRRRQASFCLHPPLYKEGMSARHQRFCTCLVQWRDWVGSTWGAGFQYQGGHTEKSSELIRWRDSYTHSGDACAFSTLKSTSTHLCGHWPVFMHLTTSHVPNRNSILFLAVSSTLIYGLVLFLPGDNFGFWQQTPLSPYQGVTGETRYEWMRLVCL